MANRSQEVHLTARQTRHNCNLIGTGPHYPVPQPGANYARCDTPYQLAMYESSFEVEWPCAEVSTVLLLRDPFERRRSLVNKHRQPCTELHKMPNDLVRLVAGVPTGQTPSRDDLAVALLRLETMSVLPTDRITDRAVAVFAQHNIHLAAAPTRPKNAHAHIDRCATARVQFETANPLDMEFYKRALTYSV